MTDVVLVIGGKAHEIWPGQTLAGLEERYHPDTLRKAVEVPSGTVTVGDLATGKKGFTPPPAKVTTPNVPRRDVLKEIDSLKAEIARLNKNAAP